MLDLIGSRDRKQTFAFRQPLKTHKTCVLMRDLIGSRDRLETFRFRQPLETFKARALMVDLIALRDRWRLSACVSRDRLAAFHTRGLACA